MATSYSCITDEQAALIRSAPVFFIATADAASADADAVNLSPKGGTPLHIISPNRVAYLDYTGSGNETARHSHAGSPATLMVCSFEADNAAIVRLYGYARSTPIADSPIADLLLESPADEMRLPMRQVIDVRIEKTATSCGYGVPVMAFVSERGIANRGRQYKGAPTPVR